jgi:site-specific DNA recombinase
MAHQPKEKPMTSDDGGKQAAIYCRISRDKEGKEGAGLGVKRQEGDCRELAARLGWTVGAVYVDNDISAYSGKRRPRYRDLLAEIKAGTVDGVLVWHTDRLHRSPVELEEYIAAVEPRKVQTQAVKAGLIDLATPTGRMIARTLGNIARFEVEHMIERQRAAKKQHREMGMWSGGPRAFGYQRDPDAPGGIKPVPEEAAAIRDGYTKLLAGVSLATISTEWNNRGLTTPKEAALGGGNPWNGTKVGDVLRRARNAGLVELQYRSDGKRTGRPEIIGPGRWEPIVDEATYLAAKAILTDPSRAIPGGRKPKYLLTGANGLVCGKCGGTVFRTQRPAGRRTSYICATLSLRPEGKMRLNGCTGRDQEWLDAFVERLIIEKLRQSGVARLASPAVDVAALDARRTALNAQLNEWASQPGITPKQVALASAPLLDELAKVEEAISSALRGSPLEQFADGEDPEDVWDGLALDMQRAVVMELMRIEILPMRGRGFKKSPGWKVGDPHEFDETSVRVTTPSGQPWGTPDT